MIKTWKPIVFSGLVAIALAGCSTKEIAPGPNNKTNDTEVQAASKSNTQQTDIDKLYNQDDNSVLVDVNGKKITLGEIKKEIFDQYAISMVNQAIDKQVLLGKYPINDDEINKKVKEMYPNGIPEGTPSTFKEDIRYNLAYEKAIRSNVTITEHDLKTIYNQQFKNSGKTYQQMRKEIQSMAPYYLGNNLNEIVSELRKSADIKYGDKYVKEQLNIINSSNTNPVDTTKGKPATTTVNTK